MGKGLTLQGEHMTTQSNVVVLPVDTATLRIESIALPDPDPHQVVVRQFASGICHSQLHQMHRPRQSPVVLGHESTGVVVEAGSAVTHVEPGDTVLVTWVPRNIEAIDGRMPGRATVDIITQREARTVLSFYRQHGPLPREPFLAACARTAKSLGHDRPLAAYLADLERQISAQREPPNHPDPEEPHEP